MGSRHLERFCGFKARLVGFGVILIMIFSFSCLRHKKDNSVTIRTKKFNGSDCSVPSAVTSLRIDGSGSSGRINWNPASSSCAVIDYSLQFRLINRDQCDYRSNENFATVATTAGTSYLLSVAVSSRHFYSTYNIRVRARNSAGLGTSSNQVQIITPKAAPNAPPANIRPTGIYSNRVSLSWDEVSCGSRQAHGPVSNVDAIALTDSPSIRVTWSPPDTIRNRCPLRYIVEYRLTVRDQCQSIDQSQPLVAANQTTVSTTITGLDGYSTYEVCVKTWNKEEYSVERCDTTTTRSSPAPTAPPSHATCTGIFTNSLDFAWDEVPCGDRGGQILEYNYRLVPASGGSSLTQTITSRSVVINEISSCTEFNFQVQAVGTNGEGPYSNVISVTTAAKAHGPVNALGATALASSPSIHVAWSLPDTSQNNNCALYFILEYELISSDLCDPIAHPRRIFAANQTSTSTTIAGLQAYSTYKVYVRTWNVAGDDGETRHVVTNTNSDKAPSEGPTTIKVTLRMRHKIAFTWEDIPCGYRHGQIITYQIRLRVLQRPYKLGFTPDTTYKQVTVLASSKLYSTSVLEPSTKYEFLVAGVNNHGVGTMAKIEAFTSVETEMDTPPPPNTDPSKSTNSTVTINVDLPRTSQYVTGIQIGVKQVHSNIEADTTPSKNDFVPDYVAGELMKENLTETFTVGDGNTYGTFYNRPLQPNTKYDIYLGSVSRISDMEFAVTWGDPVRVKVRDDYVFPVTAVLVPVLIVILLGVAVPGAIFMRKRLKKTPEDDARFVAVSGEKRFLFPRFHNDIQLQDVPTRQANSNPYHRDIREEPAYEPVGNRFGSQSQNLSADDRAGKLLGQEKTPTPTKAKMVAPTRDGRCEYPYENMPAVFLDEVTVDSKEKKIADKNITCYGAELKSNRPQKGAIIYDTPRFAACSKPKPPPRTTKPVITKSIQSAITRGASDAIPVDRFEDYVRAKKSTSFKNGNGFLEDYEKMPTPVKHPWSVAKKHANREKNRYANILPYDETRVVLETVADDPNSDYVNASYIDGVNEPRKYIASQGPTKASVADMWRLVWQENASKIVMLTNLREGVKDKCEKYWPDDITTYGNITVRLMSETTHADYVIRDFTLAIESKKQLKKVVQFHLTAWPAEGLPEDTSKVINFIKTVKQFKSEMNGTMVVHCSTGTSRTGLFITLDAMLHQAKTEGRMCIGNFTRNMIGMRMGMIQSATHYEFIFDTLLEAFKRDDTTI
ncbi:receptor-type tyrosine-protein phosphatase F-like [Patiria miniata]|uniref:protein-tyrosine-phosphatase n=1 Tax=Patiria miniata TaxID=46514 RepID=A0A914BFN5_PATMI|nr:receptor-type tyrosine-protein phosphatase F-like [Patiria miniata]